MGRSVLAWKETEVSEKTTRIKYTVADLRKAQRWWRIKYTAMVWAKWGGWILLVIGAMWVLGRRIG